ncbi:ATP-grasp domain-containing protein [Arthrobacter sp. ATA002]|nr:ATP-grasp domain-containing protein [Arthrobacter sp. ATA002]WAP51212.1 ATP-grasp domain-containing protein [Arthrobacter sp. ATA002]
MRAAVERLGLPNPRWAAVSEAADLVDFGKSAGWPVVLKTPRGGYDGKGVRIIHDAAGAAAAADWFTGGPLLAEEKVPFTRELSALVARTPGGSAHPWPVVHSIQVEGVCDEVIAPAQELDPDVAAAAQDAALRLAAELGVTGVMAVELFETPDAEPDSLSTNWPCGRTTPDTGPWTVPSPASLNSIFGLSWTCRWGPRTSWGPSSS